MYSGAFGESESRKGRRMNPISVVKSDLLRHKWYISQLIYQPAGRPQVWLELYNGLLSNFWFCDPLQKKTARLFRLLLLTPTCQWNSACATWEAVWEEGGEDKPVPALEMDGSWDFKQVTVLGSASSNWGQISSDHKLWRSESYLGTYDKMSLMLVWFLAANCPPCITHDSLLGVFSRGAKKWMGPGDKAKLPIEGMGLVMLLPCLHLFSTWIAELCHPGISFDLNPHSWSCILYPRNQLSSGLCSFSLIGGDGPFIVLRGPTHESKIQTGWQLAPAPNSRESKLLLRS